MQSATSTLKLGDIVSKTVKYIFSDLQRTVDGLGKQTEDYRTISMREFANRSKVLLMQLLIICRWIGSPETQDYISRIEAVTQRVNAIDARMNSDLDRMYFLHAGLYPLRTRAFDIATAVDILTTGTYSHLPSSMLLAEETDTHMDLDLLKEDMFIYINAKICLHEKVPDTIDSFLVDNGCLRLSKNNMFEILLTLTDLSDEASWQLVDLSLILRHHANHSFAFNGIDVYLESARLKIMESLREVCNSIQSCSLINIVSICCHSSLSLALRMMYIQANEWVRDLPQGSVELSLQAPPLANVNLILSFWKINLPTTMHLELHVVLSPFPASNYFLRLFWVDTSDPENTNKHPCDDIIQDIDCTSSLAQGISFKILYEQVLVIIANKKLEHLATRVHHSFNELSGWSVKHDKAYCTLQIFNDENTICVFIDFVTGRFITESQSTGTKMKSALVELDSEVNDLASLLSFKLALTSSLSSVSEIATVIKLFKDL